MAGKMRQGKNGGQLYTPAKGEVLNPKGRPKGALSAKTIIRKWLEVKQAQKNPFTGKMQKLTQLDIAVLKLIEKARKGDVQALNALLDRMEGKPKQAIESSGPDGAPISTETKHVVEFRRMNGK
jgi:hypothetical protein